MNRGVRVAGLFWVWAVLLVFGGPVWGQDPEKAVRASVSPSIFAEAGAGYAQVPVMVANPSLEAKTVVITVEGGGGRERRVFTRRVTVSPASTARVLMPVARWFSGHSLVRVKVDGNDIATHSMGSGRENAPGVVFITGEAKALMEPMLKYQGWIDIKTGLSSYGGRGGGSRTMYSVVNTPMHGWPTDGGEYFGVPAIVVTQEQWEKAPKEVKAAVVEHVAFGGVFGVIGEVTPEPPLMSAKPEIRETKTLEVWPAQREQAVHVAGGPVVTTVSTAPVKITRVAEQTNRAYGYGYGYFYVLPVVKPEPVVEAAATAAPAATTGGSAGKSGPGVTTRAGRAVPKPAVVDMMPARQVGHWREFISECEVLPASDLVPNAYGYSHGYGYRGHMESQWSGLKVEHDKGLSRNTMFLSLMLFSLAVVAGLVVLRIKGKKMWILVAIPALSVLCAAGLVVLTVLAEGFGGSTTVTALTHLDQRTQQARSVGLVGMYSPLGLGASGLRFDSETQILNPAGVDGGDGCVVDFTEDQHVQNGWISPRVVGYLKLAKRAAQKERLLFVKDGGGYSVTNGLGAPITKLAFRDAGGRLFSTGPVAPGATAKMKDVDGQPAHWVGEMPAEQSIKHARPGTWIRGYLLNSGLLTGPMSMGGAHVSAGEYVCELSGSPFVEDGTRGASRQKARALVLGVVGEESVR